MAKLVLFGSTGQLGSALQRCLASVLETPSGPPIKLYCPTRQECDLADLNTLTAYLLRIDPDVIINAAAFNNVDAAEQQPALAMAINARAPGCMAATLQLPRAGQGFESSSTPNAKPRIHPAHLLHFSTDYVFGNTKQQPHTEDDPPHPLSVYGQSKLAGENAIEASGCDHTLLRLSWLFGPERHNLLTRILSQLAHASATGSVLRFVDDQYSAPSDCASVASFVSQYWLPRLLTNTLPPPRLYHFRCAGIASRYQFAQALQAQLRIDERWPRAWGYCPTEGVTHRYFPCATQRPNYSVLCDARLRTAFAYEPPFWQTCLQQTLETNCDTLIAAARSSCQALG